MLSLNKKRQLSKIKGRLFLCCLFKKKASDKKSAGGFFYVVFK